MMTAQDPPACSPSRAHTPRMRRKGSLRTTLQTSKCDNQPNMSHVRTWSGMTRTALAAVGLFAINVYICRELFRIEYLNQMGSIEGVYIGLARYIMHNVGDLTWFPLWYNGIPYQNTYPPLLHWTVALVASLVRITPAHAYHFVTALLYCLGPVMWFLLALELSGSRSYSFFAGLLTSVLSPSAFVIGSVRHEIGLLRPRRFQALVAWGEGPHVASLVLLPLAVLCLHRCCVRRRPVDFVLSAIMCAAVALTNWLAAVALFAAGLAYVCATSLRPGLVAIVAATLAYGLAMPWIPPSTIGTIRTNAPFLGGYGGVYAAMPRNFVILALVGIVFVWSMRYITSSLPVRFGAFFTFFMASLVMPAFWWKVYIVPQPDRYHLEMEFGLAMLLIFTLKPLIERLAPRWRFAIAILLAAAAIIPAKSDRRFARYLMGKIDIERTIEYKTAAWIDRNVNPRRVFALGSTQFWLNAFSDTPELTGGFDNGVVNQATRTARYIISTGDGAGTSHAAIAVLWLKSLGVHGVLVSGPNTTQAYKDFRNPRMFDGVLPVLWKDGDDSLYLVPQQSDSLARIVTPESIIGRRPVNGIDTAPLLAYVAALDNPSLPHADFRWKSRHAASIECTLSPNNVVSLQISFHAGWHALVNGVKKPIAEDGIGQMYIEPHCSGACDIELVYDGGREMKIACGLSAAAWLLAIVIVGYGPIRKTLATASRFLIAV